MYDLCMNPKKLIIKLKQGRQNATETLKDENEVDGKRSSVDHTLNFWKTWKNYFRRSNEILLLLSRLEATKARKNLHIFLEVYRDHWIEEMN